MDRGWTTSAPAKKPFSLPYQQKSSCGKSALRIHGQRCRRTKKVYTRDQAFFYFIIHYSIVQHLCRSASSGCRQRKQKIAIWRLLCPYSWVVVVYMPTTSNSRSKQSIIDFLSACIPVDLFGMHALRLTAERKTANRL